MTDFQTITEGTWIHNCSSLLGGFKPADPNSSVVLNATHFTSQVGHFTEGSICISLSGVICRGSIKFTRARGTWQGQALLMPTNNQPIRWCSSFSSAALFTLPLCVDNPGFRGHYGHNSPLSTGAVKENERFLHYISDCLKNNFQ